MTGTIFSVRTAHAQAKNERGNHLVAEKPNFTADPVAEVPSVNFGVLSQAVTACMTNVFWGHADPLYGFEEMFAADVLPGLRERTKAFLLASRRKELHVYHLAYTAKVHPYDGALLRAFSSMPMRFGQEPSTHDVLQAIDALGLTYEA